MKKVLIIMGTRPEAIKMAPLIKELERHPDMFKPVVCVTAQHRDMLDQVLSLFNIIPDHDLDIMENDQNLFDITIRILQDFQQVLIKETPDIILVQGDTTTTFVSALASFYFKISIGHVEAGLRTRKKYNPFPEEMNRHLTTALADLHFAPTKKSKENLRYEGIPSDKIFVTGNTVIDALLMTVERRIDINKLAGLDIDPNKRLILVTAHRRENFGIPFRDVCYALKAIVEKNPDVEIVYPVHPNPNIKGPASEVLGNIKNIKLIEPLDYAPFVTIMNRAYLILTDSGGIQEEAPSLGKPVLVLRETTERPEAVEAGTVKIVGTNMEMIVEETQRLLDNREEYDKMARAVNPYGDGKASKRITRILQNYFYN